jgi:hypothetical protein
MEDFHLRSDPIISQQLTFAHHTIEVMLRCVAVLQFQTPAPQLAIALHGTVIELFSGCVALVECERLSAIPIVLRSLFEAVVDLDNLLQNPTYIEHMEAADLRQRKELLIQGRTNPLMSGLDLKLDLVGELKTVGPRLAELERRGHGRLKIKDRCIAVGREDEYRSIYALFTLDVHNNISALADRHTEAVNIFGVPNLTVVRGRLSLATKYAVESATMIHRAFRTQEPTIAILPSQLEAIRKAIGDIGA